MNLFNLFATLELDDKKYKKGIEDAKKDTKELGNTTQSVNKTSVKSFLATATAIATVVTVMYKLIRSTISFGDSIGKNSQKLNMSTDAYQKWALTLEMAGTDISTMSMAMKTLTGIIDNANKGSADAIILFDKLGLSFTDLADKSPEEQLLEVVEAFQGMEQGVNKTQLAIDFFGRSGQELLPLLNQEQGSVEELWKQFEELGLIMDEGAVKESEELDDKITLLIASFKQMGNSIGIDLYPAFEGILYILEKLVEFFKESKIFDLFKYLIDEMTKFADIAVSMIKNITSFNVKGLFYDVKNAFSQLINFFIDGINTLIRGLNKISIKMPDWVPGLANQKWGIDIPLIPRLKRGDDFIPKDNYMAYLDYGERVLTKEENEKYSALGGIEGMSALVNGLRNSNRQPKVNNDIVVKVQIGDKELTDVVYKAVDQAMKNKGLQNLKKVGSY